MAFQDFWWNVLTAASVTRPGRIADIPRITSDDISTRLRVNNFWARPKSVSGFDESELTFLPADERKRLAELVKSFRAEVGESGMPPPATGERLERARPLFHEIVERLEFDRFADPEAYRIGKAIERLIAPDRPAALAELRFNSGGDHTGDPSVWVWAFVRETGEHDEKTFLESTDVIDPLLEEAAREVEPERFAYISYRSTLDQPEAEAAA